MKTKLKLGVVLGLLIIIAACQKEEIPVLNDVQVETVVERDFPILGGENGATVPTTNEQSSNVLTVPATSIFEGEHGYWEGGDVVTTPTDLPDHDLNQAVENAVESEKILRQPTITWLDKKPTDKKWVFIDTSIDVDVDMSKQSIEPVVLCAYEDCSTAIPNIIAQSQILANEQCRDIYRCIACCSNNHVMYISMVIRHQCGIMTPVEDF